MKLKYELSNLALNDLEEIWKYTIDNWSSNQANKYYEIILNEISKICQNPEIGRSMDRIVNTHRLRQIQSHIIVNKIKEELILVDRILHKRMDIKSRFNL